MTYETTLQIDWKSNTNDLLSALQEAYPEKSLLHTATLENLSNMHCHLPLEDGACFLGQELSYYGMALYQIETQGDATAFWIKDVPNNKDQIPDDSFQMIYQQRIDDDISEISYLATYNLLKESRKAWGEKAKRIRNSKVAVIDQIWGAGLGLRLDFVSDRFIVINNQAIGDLNQINPFFTSPDIQSINDLVHVVFWKGFENDIYAETSEDGLGVEEERFYPLLVDDMSSSSTTIRIAFQRFVSKMIRVQKKSKKRISECTFHFIEASHDLSSYKFKDIINITDGVLPTLEKQAELSIRHVLITNTGYLTICNTRGRQHRRKNLINEQLFILHHSQDGSVKSWIELPVVNINVRTESSFIIDKSTNNIYVIHQGQLFHLNTTEQVKLTILSHIPATIASNAIIIQELPSQKKGSWILSTNKFKNVFYLLAHHLESGQVIGRSLEGMQPKLETCYYNQNICLTLLPNDWIMLDIQGDNFGITDTAWIWDYPSDQFIAITIPMIDKHRDNPKLSYHPNHNCLFAITESYDYPSQLIKLIPLPRMLELIQAQKSLQRDVSTWVEYSEISK